MEVLAHFPSDGQPPFIPPIVKIRNRQKEALDPKYREEGTGNSIRELTPLTLFNLRGTS